MEPITFTVQIVYMVMNKLASKIDIGKLTFEWIKEKDSYENIKGFIKEKLKFIDANKAIIEPINGVHKAKAIRLAPLPLSSPILFATLVPITNRNTYKT